MQRLDRLRAGPPADAAPVDRSGEPETEVIAEHGEDPAEGARDLDDDTQSAESGGSLEHGEPEASSEDRVASEADNTISESEGDS